MHAGEDMGSIGEVDIGTKDLVGPSAGEQAAVIGGRKGELGA